MSDEKPTAERLCPRLALACEKCGTSGLIPWDRLDRVLCCHSCHTLYRVDRGTLTEIAAPEEKLHVAVRGGMSHWQQHSLDTKHRWRPRNWQAVLLAPLEWLQLAGWPMRSAIAGGIVAMVLAAVLLCSGKAAESTAPVSLPPELTDRAALFAQAWLGRDVPMLLRLTDKSKDRQLRRWFSQSPPPLAGEAAVPPTVEAAVERRQAHYAVVSVRIHMPNETGKNGLRQRQEWVEQNGDWYFLPSVAISAKPHAR